MVAPAGSDALFSSDSTLITAGSYLTVNATDCTEPSEANWIGKPFCVPLSRSTDSPGARAKLGVLTTVLLASLITNESV